MVTRHVLIFIFAESTRHQLLRTAIFMRDAVRRPRHDRTGRTFPSSEVPSGRVKVHNRRHNLIIALALRHRLPAHYATAESVIAGGLVCYGHDFGDSFRKTAEYVDRILRRSRATFRCRCRQNLS
jgi:hypothetical protein